jgi:uncharacterized membrane protein
MAAPVVTAAPPTPSRLTAVDALRGLVMVIMALDHTRDFFHLGAMTFSPEDLTRTTPFLFFTRWITHICAPVFFLTAGLGARLRLDRPGATKAQLSRFLVTRGLWLIVIELTVMRLAMNFSLGGTAPVLLLILWALGASMIALAVLIYLPARVLAGVSLAVLVLHNTLDPVQAARFGAWAPLWNMLHQQGAFVPGGIVFVVAYPVLPWIAVMALGYCAGALFQLAPERRQRVFWRVGLALTVLFVLVRAVNVYGDPAPWATQSTWGMTVVSFFRATKYPPSLQFLLMTLGPGLMLLAYFDRRAPGAGNPLVVIGRVPFFYYVAHFWLLHILASAFAFVRYGNASLAYLLSPLPSMGGDRALFPADFGYPLWVTYAVWIAVVVLLYPLCRWFASLKARRREWWLSYL